MNKIVLLHIGIDPNVTSDLFLSNSKKNVLYIRSYLLIVFECILYRL